MGELVGVPEQAIRAFSTRRQSLLEHMQEQGREGFTAARVAALATREAKEPVDLARLRADWRARAAEHGLGRRELRALLRERCPEREGLAAEQLAATLFGRERLTEKRTTFTLPELVRAVAGALGQGGSVEQVLETAEELSRFPGIELVEPGDLPGRPARFTTRELLAVEREALELALAGRDGDAPRPLGAVLAEALISSGRGLSGEQRMLVHQAGRSPDRVVCVVGVAGSGKTTALHALADAYRKAGIPILGAAPSGRAADELETETGISSRTLHRLLLDAERDGGLPRRCLLVVDEAGMAETRVLAPLLQLVDRAEGKAILVGDPAQLPAVGAGGLYAALCHRLCTVDLSEHRRQRDRDERRALTHMRAGDPEPYLAHAARHGRLHVAENELDAKRRLLDDWWQAANGAPARAVMLAYHRDDVDELNQAAHARMRASHQLGPRALQLGSGEFRVGDRVLCRRNDNRLHVRNGTRGTIVDHDHDTLTIRTDTGIVCRLPLAYAREHLEHGYALTGHAAQGLTVDRAYVLLHDRGSLREWGYVASTRARTETRLYLTSRTHERDTHGRELDPAASTEHAARALARSAAEPLALEQGRQRGDTILNFYAQQQEQLGRHRERTEKELAAAQRERRHLHWWNRDRREALEIEIADHQKMLDRADVKAEKLRRDAELRMARLAQHSKTLALALQRGERATSLQPEPPRRSPAIKLGREPPGLEL